MAHTDSGQREGSTGTQLKDRSEWRVEGGETYFHSHYYEDSGEAGSVDDGWDVIADDPTLAQDVAEAGLDLLTPAILNDPEKLLEQASRLIPILKRRMGTEIPTEDSPDRFVMPVHADEEAG